VVDSVETYLLSAADAEVVKIRADLMDAAGLELWTQAMKAGFPPSAEDRTAALGALAVSLDDPPARPAYTVAELLTEVVAPHPDLMAFEVRKHCRLYRVDGCMAELTDVSTDRGSTSTVAVESKDAAFVVATVERPGLTPGATPTTCGG
jgi:exopolyphosphatase / guanosine-5'-triphosphate,3'-diphosphate pyrophosphatase